MATTTKYFDNNEQITLPGPQGNQGNQGSQGYQGAPSTVQGPQGNQGNQGSTGGVGPQGPQGNQGNQGNIGVTGSQGTQGVGGATGPQGNQGNQGIQGPQMFENVNVMSTGVLTGYYLRINGSDNTKFDIYKGSDASNTAVVVNNYTNPLAPTLTVVTIADQIAVVPTVIATGSLSYIAIDASGNIHQSNTFWTPGQSRDWFYVGTLIHSDRVHIQAVSNAPTYPADVYLQLRDFFDSFGRFNIDGNVVGANGANLQLNKSAGATWAAGVAYDSGRSNPNIVPDGATTGSWFLYAETESGPSPPQTWTASAPTIYVDPNNYDTLNGLAAVPAGKWTIQTFFWATDLQVLYIQYGQQYYDSLLLATEAMQNAFVVDPNLGWATFRGYMIVQQGATALNDPAQAAFFPAGKLGLASIISGGSGGEANTASNVGLAGVGLYYTKAGVNLEFLNIRSVNPNISVTYNAAMKTIDLDTAHTEVLLESHQLSLTQGVLAGSVLTMAANPVAGDKTIVSGGQAPGLYNLGTTVAVNGNPYGICTDGPLSRWVYVSDPYSYKRIYVYARNPLNGQLGTSISYINTTDAVMELCNDNTGYYLYGVDTTNNLLLEFSINQSTGALAQIGSIAFASVGNGQQIIATPNGKYIYGASFSENLVYAFLKNSGDGTLTLIGTYATYSHPSGVCVDNNSAWLYVTNATGNTISQFAIQSDGSLTSITSPIASHSATPEAICIDRTNQFLFVAAASGNYIDVYSVNQSTGALGYLSSSASITGPIGLQRDILRNQIYCATNTNYVYALSYNLSTGALTILNYLATGTDTAYNRRIANEGTGQNIYVVNDNGYTINQFSINSVVRTYCASTGGDVQYAIGLTPAATMTNLVAAIMGDASAIWNAYLCTGLGDIAATTVVIEEKSTGYAGSTICGIWATQANCQIVDFTGLGDYLSNTLTTLPSSLPAVTNFGFERVLANLQNGGYHFVRNSAATYPFYFWSADIPEWLPFGNQGPQGYQGNQGYQGYQGAASTVQGPQGSTGGTGPQGNQGNQGNASTVPGPQGPQGNQGNQANVYTTTSFTYYVRTTGNDSNDGLTVGTALLTIQAAIDKLPIQIRTAITIDVGPGTFTGFSLDGRVQVTGQAGSSLTITGANFINYTPVGGGTGSGTFNSGTGDFRTGGDSTQSWAVNALRGKICYVNGVYQIVRKNTVTTLELVGASASTLNGKTYQIMNWSTILNAVPSESVLGWGVIQVVNNSGISDMPSAGITITQFAVTPPDGYDGIDLYQTSVPTFSFISITGGFYGLYSQDLNIGMTITDFVVNGQSYSGLLAFIVPALTEFSRILVFNTGTGGGCYAFAVLSVAYIYDCSDWYVDNNNGTPINQGGICFEGVKVGFIKNVYTTSNDGGGVAFSNCQSFRIINLTDTSNAHGVILYGNISNYYNITSSVLLIGTINISDNTGDGLHIMGPASFRLEGAVGTGNGGWGVRAANGSKIYMNAATTLTGSLGDATVNNVNALSWATNFASDGDSAVNLSDLSMIIRRESME